MDDGRLDWEFNAPHWCDFSQEDVDGNADAWFDEQTAKLVAIHHPPPDHAAPPEPVAATRRRPTRIPVHSCRKSRASSDCEGGAAATARLPTEKAPLAKKPSSRSEPKHLSKATSGKLPARVPLAQRRNMK
jgi:hypothetical protein